MTVPALFEPLTLRDLTVAHRGWVAPMCQYSCDPVEAPGVPTDWHLVHLGGFAVGGAAMIITEATAVNPEGRISPQDTGIWNDEQAAAWRRIVEFVHSHGIDAKIGVQLAHAGRKASTYPPFADRHGSVPVSEHGWATLAPTDAAFDGYAAPSAMTEDQILAVVDDFAAAAARAVDAGFDTVELHAAHGYLLHEFLSPLVNDRADGWGGNDEGRMRLPLAVIDAVRATLPDGMPLLMRISASDWEDIEADLTFSSRFVSLAHEHGVDLVDVSSAGNLAAPKVRGGAGYQTGFAERIRRDTKVPTSTVGMITDPVQAEHILLSGQADVVTIARAALADPRWWLRAAHRLGHDLTWVPQYQRVSPSRVY
ncbi:oxidoreductase [Tersicoccus solisilvae]|uniref:Oxidoreductase n=1 Tax=Tersicoccus solisilvae TaxID=1882339 RepID=A0ABQ1NN85_9MICC|nr:NADH:flavin oxidoreductase/NADH oxidase [Tersicoccus solisilvae]GGC78521.1 oxidoreductase [Tersicoccus solisilvae]